MVLKGLCEYAKVVGDEVIIDLVKQVKRLSKRHVLNINSTFLGGGVAEILHSFIPLANCFGMDYEWRVLHGSMPFYNITKQIHNGLQGENVLFKEDNKALYRAINNAYATYTKMNQDYVIIHDPQPLPLIQHVSNFSKSVWRCHIDLSSPNEELWNYLKDYLLLCDLVIVSREEYKKDDLAVEQRVILPAIDPFSSKNMELSTEKINWLITLAGIPVDKPIITQVSRMDKWKDPEGLLEIYELVRKKVDCRLLYCFNSATDDPEREQILNRIKEKAKDLIERKDILLVEGDNPYLVNAIQRYSDVIIQKSIKEGFCLAVTEALWKKTPVVASNVGGIPSQIIDGETGYLIDPNNYQDFADVIELLIKDRTLANTVCVAAKEFVREKFLLTRLLKDYLNVFEELL